MYMFHCLCFADLYRKYIVKSRFHSGDEHPLLFSFEHKLKIHGTNDTSKFILISAKTVI